MFMYPDLEGSARVEHPKQKSGSSVPERDESVPLLPDPGTICPTEQLTRHPYELLY